MTLGSCRDKKEDSVRARPQKTCVNLLMVAQCAMQSKHNTMFILSQKHTRYNGIAPWAPAVHRQKSTSIYMETMTSTSKPADDFSALEALDC